MNLTFCLLPHQGAFGVFFFFFFFLQDFRKKAQDANFTLSESFSFVLITPVSGEQSFLIYVERTCNVAMEKNTESVII